MSTVKREKVRKIINIVVSTLSIIIACFALVLIVSTISSSKKGYTSIFGYAYFTVASGSMDVGEEGFAENDIIYIKLLNEKQKADLKQGDVVTFWDTIGGKKELNTHRISRLVTLDDGSVMYRTKGDANLDEDRFAHSAEDIQGIYKGKAIGFGSAIMWLQTKTGFLVSVLIPSILIVIYCLYLVIFNVIDFNKKKLVLAKEEMKEEMDGELRKKLKEELLLEMEEKAKEQEPPKE